VYIIIYIILRWISIGPWDPILSYRKIFGERKKDKMNETRKIDGLYCSADVRSTEAWRARVVKFNNSNNVY
jgi:hypothetical protein